jgi:hypothetical protein
VSLSHLRRALWVLRHPLIVLVIGTCLSIWLVPIFSARIDHDKLIHEARLKRAMEIISDNIENERNLNRLLTTLAIFHKDNSGPAARFVNLQTEQKELRRIMVERYSEFDRQAWWLYSQIYVEAKILGIASQPELEHLEQISRQYAENLKDSMAAIDELWNAFLRENYKPSSSRNKELIEQTRQKLDKLNAKRSELVMESAQIFVEH